MRLWRTPIQGCFWCLLLFALRTALADCVSVICIPIFSGSRIRTELERFTCAAMLRMQTLVCAPERCFGFFRLQLPWDRIRCVRWHPPWALPNGCASELLLQLLGRPGTRTCPRSRRVMVRAKSCNLVDPASSHMLVSKIKPCMSKYKLLYGETANGSLKQLSSP